MTFAPATLRYADGSTILLVREGNTVTMTATAGSNPSDPGNVAQPIPADFIPAGDMSMTIVSPSRTWAVLVSTIPSVVGFGGLWLIGIAQGPYPDPIVVQWIAAPVGNQPDGYILNPQEEQDSITAFLREQYPHIPVIEDGLLDDESDVIEKNLDESIKPFIVLWYSNAKRSSKGRSMANYKLDSHFATVDVVVVTRNGAEGRKLLNDVSDRLVGFRTGTGGRMHKGSALWGDSRNIIMDKDRPTRFARTDRFDFGIQARKVN